MIDKKIIRFFISYAHVDEKDSCLFLESFKEMAGASKKYRYEFWQDTCILPGEKWKLTIQNALDECAMGILLISPAFLGSKFISEQEIPKFIGDNAKPLVPIMLKKINLSRHDLKGLEENQIFRLKKKGGDGLDLKSYAQCGSRQKYDFVYELFDRVETLLDKNC